MELNKLAQSWLAMQCQLTAGTYQAICLFDFKPSSEKVCMAWPASDAIDPALKQQAELAVQQQQNIISPVTPRTGTDQSVNRIACPLTINGQVCGAIVLEVSARPQVQLEAAIKLLQWSAQWLQFLLEQSNETSTNDYSMLFLLSLPGLEHSSFKAAATAVVNEIAALLTCDRVSYGIVEGQQNQVKAISHSADIKKNANLITHLSSAMNEAMRQDCILQWPLINENNIQLDRAHRELAKQHRSKVICTVPTVYDQQVVGALTLERKDHQPFDQATLQLLEHCADFIGALLFLKYRDEQGLVYRFKKTVRHWQTSLFGSSHTLLKTNCVIIGLLILLLSVAKDDYKVTADALLQGEVQRVVVAPIDGYIATTAARAGDVVKVGSVIGTLDDKDLNLEHMKWTTKAQQLHNEYREAMAKHERAKVSVLSAQLQQANTQVELVQEQLARTQLIAPFDGIIIEGDLDQALGSPVSRGDVLYKIAPLDQYRMVLKVDEREITDVQPGQQGNLLLPGMPDHKIPFEVKKIIPVSSSEQGKNFFEVETTIKLPSKQLRPGMQGIGKIAIGKRNIFWVWTHKLLRGIKFWLWSVLP